MKLALAMYNATLPIVKRLVILQKDLGLRTEQVNGVEVIDCGVNVTGSLEAGCLVGKITTAGAAEVQMIAGGPPGRPHLQIIFSTNPTQSCLLSEFAGAQISADEFTMGSGPARAIALAERALYDEFGVESEAAPAILVAERSTLPDADEVVRLLERFTPSKAEPMRDGAYIIVVPTKSLVGQIQINLRVVEAAVHSLHANGFPMDSLLYAIGQVPMSVSGGKTNDAMGRSNDVIRFGGVVSFGTTAPYHVVAEKGVYGANAPPSATKTFFDVLDAHGGKFENVPAQAFAPAQVRFHCTQTGGEQVFGALNQALLNEVFTRIPKPA